MNRKPGDILDELLVLRIQGGDQAALTELISRWQPRLRMRAQRITGRPDVAADVVQEAWLAVIRGINRLKDPGTFRSWAYRIVHNKSVDWVRQQSRRRELVAELRDQQCEDANEVPEQETPADNLHQLRGAIREMTVDGQELLRMYYTDGMSLKEIAFVTKVPTGTLKYRLFKLRQQLKANIERNRT